MDTEHDGRQVAVRAGLTLNGVVVPTLVGAGLSMVSLSPPEFSYARWCFIAAAVSVGGLGAAWLIVTDQGFGSRLFWGATLGLLVFILFPLAMRWVTTRQEIWVASQFAAASTPAPPETPATPETKPVEPPKLLPDQTRNTTPRPISRRLTQQQDGTIGHYLYDKNFYKFIAEYMFIYKAPVAGDVENIANDFEQLFSQLGIATNIQPHTPSGPGQTGLMVAVSDVNKPPEGAKVLFDALKASGLSPRYVPVSANPRGGPSFALFIGPPP